MASLSRTLESLEARLARLPTRTERSTAAPRDVRRAPEPAKQRAGALADAVSEIAMRRRILDAAPIEPAPSAPAAVVSERLERRIETIASQAETLSGDDASLRLMTEVASELQRLRGEMRDGAKQASFEARFDELRAAFEQLRQMIGDRAGAEAIGEELRQISASLARLTEAGADRAMLNSMRSELEELRHLFEETARETTVRAVDERWQSFEDRYAARSEDDQTAKAELKRELERLRESLRSLAREEQVQAVEDRWSAFEQRYREPPSREAISGVLREELDGMRAKLESAVADPSRMQAMEARWDELEKRLELQRNDEGVRLLAERMSEIEERLSRLPGSVDVSSLEQRIHALAENMDGLARRSEQADMENFLSLEERLDEISRAIVAVAAPPAMDMAPIERIEARIAALSGRVDQMGNDGKVERLSKRIADLSARVEELAAEAIGPAVMQRIDQLTERFETAFAEFEPPQIDTSAIEKRIDLIAERFELAVADLHATKIDPDAFEQRLSALAAKLESLSSEPRIDVQAVRSLEEQIERLSERVVHSGSLHDDFETEITSRLGAIEQRLDSHRDALIQAAREVAEETARRMQIVGDERQAEHVAQLSESLQTLEGLARSNDSRSGQVFQAVHDTLLKIVDRLEQIEVEIAAGDRGHVVASSFGLHADRSFEAATSPAFAMPAAEPPAARIREQVASPALDAADVIDREEINRPLEPGSGMPDIGALLERVRAAQRSRTEDIAEPGSEAETRAAARSAARAASLEAEKLTAGAPPVGEKGLRGLLSRRRKAILTGVVAVIVALSALPIGKSFIGGEERTPATVAALAPPPAASEPAPVTAEVPTPAPQQAAAPVEAPAAPAIEAGKSSDVASALSAATPLPATTDRSQPETPAAPADVAETAAPDDQADASGPAVDAIAALKPKLPASATVMPPVPDGIGPAALKAAALAGDPKAAFEIGLRLMEGRPGQPEPEKALDWFAQAAVKGFAPAQYSIGTLYEKGNGIARDTQAARDWYTLAATSGNVRAMHNLAVLYATGIDGRSQPEAAARWFTQAAEHGMRDSQYNLGILYARGSGVPQDLGQSYKWFAIVADAGDSDAATKRDEIAKSMKPDQLQAAQETVRSFQPAPRIELANTVDTPAEWQDANERTTSSIDMTKAVRNIQAILGKLGYDAGVPDGRVGDKTKVAIEAFQRDNGLKATGEIDGPLIRALLRKKDAKAGV
ncbi:peptidoglycan-binding protein [Aureimonas leprariae]|uniref:Peptidoglycan binding-like domain-containing protein n=1 Tax=Plantimonas leprariae TaxID=2615207 RepID=A0A7V7PKQ9_9HYPH|nr:peptidoglycan-binding protein [Aureimonas leprariae]KAB0676557.1 hypothetical protein F6X38_20955 [Aureimonas leprariae]